MEFPNFFPRAMTQHPQAMTNSTSPTNQCNPKHGKIYPAISEKKSEKKGKSHSKILKLTKNVLGRSPKSMLKPHKPW
jgi:hypothetical protein